MTHQLPAWSPVSLGGLAAGLAPPRDAVTGLAELIRSEYGAHRVALTGSGTDALAIAIRAAAPEGRRPRVALPGWACYDLMTAADAVDAEVVLYDLIPETLAPDPDSLRLALTARPDAVVVAHWFGIPVDLSRIAALVGSAGAVLIDDAAQGVGASVRGRPAGAGGDFGILSFGRGKGRTGGAGGALMAFGDAAVKSLAAAEAMLKQPAGGFRSVAVLAAQWVFGRPWLYGIPARAPGIGLGQTMYHSAAEPSRIAPRNAAIVASVWEASAVEAEIRRSNARRWGVLLAGLDGLTTYGAPADATGGWLRYPVLTSPRLRASLIGSLARRLGVMPGYPGVLADLPVRSGRLVSTSDCPGARRLSAELVTLPTHHLLRNSDLEGVRKLGQFQK